MFLQCINIVFKNAYFAYNKIKKKNNIRPSEQFQNLMTKSQKQANSKLLAHIYMTAHSPDLVW